MPRTHAFPLAAACFALALFPGAPAAAREAPATSLDYTEASIAEINEAIDAGALNSERLVQMSLARIAAYDEAGPGLNAVRALNPHALERARELDAERERRGRRSPLHGIPVLLKDNIDTADLPTTAGSFMLAGSLPPDDAHLVRRLREAGAVILGKLNMSEFASGGPSNSLDGWVLNPHDPERTPQGSSGGTGAAIAAAYAPVGLGTDTGGSIRSPSAANGIVGLKPTHGLISRDGIVPLALSFDTVGPMARHVADVAAALTVLAGVDPADPATEKAKGRIEKDYTAFLDADALNGARIGVARDFMGQDEEVDWLVEAALAAMRDAGAEVVDVKLPSWLLDVRGRFYRVVRYREFKAQVADYLGTLGPDYPKTLDDLVQRSMRLTAPGADGARPNPGRWELMLRENRAGTLEDSEYLAVKKHALPLVAATLEGLMADRELDALVYPTRPERPPRADEDPESGGAPGSGGSPVILANLAGFPDLSVPAGFTGRGLPVNVSFLGPAFSEPRLLALGYAFEQRTRTRRLPVTTPPLPSDRVTGD